MEKFKWLLKTTGILIFINVFALFVVYILTSLGLDFNNERATTYILLISQAVIGLTTYLLIRIRKKRTAGAYIYNQGINKDSWKMVIIGLGAAGFGNILLSIVIKILGENSLVKDSIDLVNTVFNASDPFTLILQTLSVAIIAPIVEEYLFRGYIFTESRKGFSPASAIVLNGLVFGIYHMNLLQGINTFILGILLATIYYYRRNISDVILIHAANNTIAIISAFLPQAASIIGVLLIISLIIAIYMVYKIIKNGKAAYKKVSNQEI